MRRVTGGRGEVRVTGSTFYASKGLAGMTAKGKGRASVGEASRLGRNTQLSSIFC